MAAARGVVSAYREIRCLRRRGLSLPWDVSLGITPTTIVTFGINCDIGRGSLLALEQGTLALGDNVLIGAYGNIRAVDSSIRIGSRVQVAQFVSLIAAGHLIDDRGVPLIGHDLRPGRHGIAIGDDCWLGANSAVLPGVTLGDRCIVAAGAVVTKSFPTGSKLRGVPARAF
jgi:acetyltransferase-like isoleucine patch superfamily enzyme